MPTRQALVLAAIVVFGLACDRGSTSAIDPGSPASGPADTSAADPRTQRALEEAVQKTARNDTDVDSVRTQEWFVTSIGTNK